MFKTSSEVVIGKHRFLYSLKREQSPLKEVMAVLQAREMLWPYTGEKYTNNCELQGVEYSTGERRINLNLGEETNLSFEHKTEISVYPNPAQEYVVVELSKIEEALLEVFDLSGRRYILERLNKTNRIDLSELANGAYLYRINKDGKLLKAGKLILNR